MIRRPPRSTRTDTLFPYTTLFRSLRALRLPRAAAGAHHSARNVPSPLQCSPPCESSCAAHLRHTIYQALCSVSRSEEHTSELQSLMRISYAVFCLKKKM